MDKNELIETLDSCVQEIVEHLKKNNKKITHENVMDFYDEHDYFQNIYGPAGRYIMDKILSHKT